MPALKCLPVTAIDGLIHVLAGDAPAKRCFPATLYILYILYTLFPTLVRTFLHPRYAGWPG